MLAAIRRARCDGSFACHKLSRCFSSAIHSHTVYVALGSNIGHCIQHINSALQQLRAHDHITLLDTSHMYRSQPMYLDHQPPYLNAACKISTSLPPLELMHQLQSIERQIGRVYGGVRNGPRCIDLDILVYDDAVIDSETLQLPHPRLHEREFVLRPLIDINPALIIPAAVNQTATAAAAAPATVQQLLSALQQSTAGAPQQLQRVMPLLSGKVNNDNCIVWNARTYVMGILNMTPDSFSDGGQHNNSSSSSSSDSALRHVEAMLLAGADVIDIGGQSTRPHQSTAPLTATEELLRVMPIVLSIRQHFPDTAISIDTYYSEVAKACLAATTAATNAESNFAATAGVAFINDISGGNMDAAMRTVVAAHSSAYCAMHMRGTPATMTQQPFVTYNDLIRDVNTESRSVLQSALDRGVYRWNLMADPGLGFAKTSAQSLQLLRSLDQYRPLPGVPLLLGTSRKSFLAQAVASSRGASVSTVTNQDRVTATVASITACVQGGADMIRVHDVKEAKVAAAIADAMYRGKAV